MLKISEMDSKTHVGKSQTIMNINENIYFSTVKKNPYFLKFR